MWTKLKDWWAGLSGGTRTLIIVAVGCFAAGAIFL
jgi:hypothetical protein